LDDTLHIIRFFYNNDEHIILKVLAAAKNEWNLESTSLSKIDSNQVGMFHFVQTLFVASLIGI